MPAADRAAPICRLETTGPGRYALHGDLGFGTVAVLLREGEQAFAGQASVEVDLSGLTHADSAGLALLIEWTRQLRGAGRKIAFTGMPERLAAIARIGGVADLLPQAG